MEIGKVLGTVVATRKDPSLIGTRLLVVQQIDHEHNPIGPPIVAADPDYLAGNGDIVFMVTGGDAVFVAGEKPMPVDIAIVGIVDSITLGNEV